MALRQQNMNTFSAAILEGLRAFDTPTICNALESILPESRSSGFNRRPLFSPSGRSRPVVGYACTARIQSRESLRGDAVARRLEYYADIERSPRPSLALVQDIDSPDRGLGAFWGEIQTNVHLALGCSGVITDGSVRDIDQIPEKFFVLAGSVMPSHVFADIVDFNCAVNVAGVTVHPGDLVHADHHGMIIVPEEAVPALPAAATLISRKERIILDACRLEGFSVNHLRRAFEEMDEIH
jgi:regulator of RNase E activity RraA